jgi:hypothetical protein
VPRIAYIPKRFSREHLAVIRHANAFLGEFARGGYQVTLRTLYYAFVKSNLIRNDQKEYKRLGKIVGDARLAGLIDWSYIEDRMRGIDSLKNFEGPQTALDWLTRVYRVDMWRNQKVRPEVWIEKDALSGIVRGVCEENDVPFLCCRGYTSLSEMWRASLRLQAYREEGKTPIILHFGDHDPSGVDMSRDIFTRLRETFVQDCEFQRLALNMDQIEALDLPPNPAKVRDSRFKVYAEQFGDESWELDALNPSTFRDLITETLNKVRDARQWKEDAAEAVAVRGRLKEVAKEWEELPRQKQKITDLTAEVSAARAATEKAVTELSEVRAKYAVLKSAAERIAKKVTKKTPKKGGQSDRRDPHGDANV